MFHCWFIISSNSSIQCQTPIHFQSQHTLLDPSSFQIQAYMARPQLISNPSIHGQNSISFQSKHTQLDLSSFLTQSKLPDLTSLPSGKADVSTEGSTGWRQQRASVLSLQMVQILNICKRFGRGPLSLSRSLSALQTDPPCGKPIDCNPGHPTCSK